MKKFSKTILISSIFLIFTFTLCILYGQFFIKLPELINSSISKYKFLCGLKYFCIILPAVFATSVNISWSIEFGLNPHNSRLRFSDAMFGRYKKIILTSLIMILIITCGTEIALPTIYAQLKHEETLPVLMHEYQNTAKNLYDSSKYESAFHYAKLAYEIDPEDKTNKELIYITEIYYNKEAEVSNNLITQINELTFKDPTFGVSKTKKAPATSPYKTYELLTTAKNCLSEKDWFGAHYYAQLGLQASSSKDINQTELKQIAATAWNNLNQTRLAGTTEDQIVFAKKYEGYVNLVNGDILRAYYIYRALSLQSKKLSIDPDVVRYLTIAQNSLENQYFFTDETKNLKGYESARNVYFKLVDKKTGSTTLYFIKGVTTTGSGSNMIQYLRGLEIISLDSVGFYRSGYYVPYAKLSCMMTTSFDKEALSTMGIDEGLKAIPFIQLNSVDRNFPDSVSGPIYKGGYSLKNADPYIILNMSFYDFDLIKQASNGAETMNLISIFNFVNKAADYGYSEEVFEHVLLNRLMNPIFLLILFLIVGWLAWHFRLNEDSVFKFKWIVMFPLLGFAYALLYQLAECLFKFINYGVLGFTSVSSYICAASVLYIILLIIASLIFLSCRNAEGK